MRTNSASRLIIGAALAVTLTGCFKIDMDITVNSNDTVDGTVILGLERRAAGLLGLSEDQLRRELEGDLTSDLPEGGRAEPYQDDRFIGTKVTLDDVTLDEFNEGSATGDLSIARQGDTFVVSGQLDLTEEELNAGGLEGFDELAGTAETQLRMTFPGDVTETNGELSNEDRTVTWHPQVGEVTEINAVADAGSGGGVPAWLWPLLGIAAIVVAGLVFLNLRKREPVLETAATPAAGYPARPEAESPTGPAEPLVTPIADRDEDPFAGEQPTLDLGPWPPKDPPDSPSERLR